MSNTANPRLRGYNVSILKNQNAGKASGKRPFAIRKQTSFTRPAAKYDNPSWEENIARVEAINVAPPKKRKS